MKVYISFLLFVNSALALYATPFSYSGINFETGEIFLHPRHLALRDNPDNLTLPQAEAGYAAMCGSANSAIGLAAVQADINNVTVNSLAIEAQFRTVLTQLTAIENRSLTTQKFAPTWNGFYNQWTDILWASRNTASDTVAYTQNFIDTLMPFVVNASGSSCPPALGAELLEEYIQEAAGLKSNAQITSQNFTQLQTNLIIFAGSFSNFAANQSSTISSQIAALKNDIQRLDALIQSLSNQISSVGSALGVSLFAEIGILALLPFAGPFIIFAGFAAVVNAGAIAQQQATISSLSSQKSAAQSQLNSDLSQISRLQSQLTQIANANQTLNSIGNTTIPNMITQLSAFNGIWDAVIGDCQAGIQYLTLSGGPTSQLVPQIFWSTIEHVPCIYEQLIPALNQYTAGIGSAGLPSPSIAVRPAALDHVQFRAKVKTMVGNAMLKAAAMSELEL